VTRTGRDYTTGVRDIGTNTMERSPAQTAAAGSGVLFTLLGILGFIPGITTHLRDIKFAGHNSGAELFRDVSRPHGWSNLVSIAIGPGRPIAAARSFFVRRAAG